MFQGYLSYSKCMEERTAKLISVLEAPGSCNKPVTLLGSHKCEYNAPQGSALSTALAWQQPTEKQPKVNVADAEDTPMKDAAPPGLYSYTYGNQIISCLSYYYASWNCF